MPIAFLKTFNGTKIFTIDLETNVHIATAVTMFKNSCLPLVRVAMNYQIHPILQKGITHSGTAENHVKLSGFVSHISGKRDVMSNSDQ